MTTCKDYCGVSCVDGSCPNALVDDYPEYGFVSCSCNDCLYNQGCADCMWQGTEMCKEGK